MKLSLIREDLDENMRQSDSIWGSMDKVVIISQTKETTIKHHTIDGKSSLRVRPKAEEMVDP